MAEAQPGYSYTTKRSAILEPACIREAGALALMQETEKTLRGDPHVW